MTWLLLATVFGLASAAILAWRRRSLAFGPGGAPPSAGLRQPAVAAPRHTAAAAHGPVAARLAAHFAHRRDYRVFVEVPAVAPDTWLVATGVRASAITLGDGRSVPDNHVQAYLVAYPNGEIVDGFNLFAPLPDGVHARDFDADTGVLPPAAPREWERGRLFALVAHGRATPDPSRPGILRYATSLRNVGREPFRVLYFGGYAPRSHAMAPGKRYSADDFVQWYGAATDGWVAAGQTVADPNNWGTSGVTWAYFCVTAGGQQFVAAATAP